MYPEWGLRNWCEASTSFDAINPIFYSCDVGVGYEESVVADSETILYVVQNHSENTFIMAVENDRTLIFCEDFTKILTGIWMSQQKEAAQKKFAYD